MVDEVKPIVYAEEYHEDKPSIFRESENLDRLLQAIFDVCYQQQLDFLWLSQNLLNVDVAEKSHLDFIGNIVGQPRFLSDFNTEPYFGYEGSYQSKPFSSVTNPDIGGFWNSRSHFNTATARQLNDDEYRRLIKARAIYNQSNCTANDLLEVVNLITDSDDNTVQLLKHGLIQIKTSDKTGILSYFVDRLYLEDNILPIAAGVRVGLEQSTSDGSDGSGGGSNALEMNFLKFRTEIIEEPQEVTAGILYKINDGLINAAILPTGSSIVHTTLSVLGAGSDSGLVNHFLGYETDLRDYGNGFVPMPLEQNASYLLGMDNTIFAEFAATLGLPSFEGINGETVLTLYPASVMPSANIDYDVFDLIIDPASYTQADLQYFSERGVTPATKNPDGSYTLKSQLTVLPPN